MAELDYGFRATQEQGPAFTMAEKPEMVIGGPVPSWQKSIPGPKYDVVTDNYKQKAPGWSLRGKPEMVIGGAVPSWQKSIPGPKYLININEFKPKAPSFSMRGRNPPKTQGELEKERAALHPARSSSEKKFPAPQLDTGYKCTQVQGPGFSMRAKPDMVVGGPVPSWTNSIPGPKYDPALDSYKAKAPGFTLRQKPEMIIGGAVPSWQKSIPGPKYMININEFKPKAPSFSMPGRNPPKMQHQKDKERAEMLAKSSSAPNLRKTA